MPALAPLVLLSNQYETFPAYCSSAARHCPAQWPSMPGPVRSWTACLARTCPVPLYSANSVIVHPAWLQPCPALPYTALPVSIWFCLPCWSFPAQPFSALSDPSWPCPVLLTGTARHFPTLPEPVSRYPARHCPAHPCPALSGTVWPCPALPGMYKIL